MRTDKDIVIQLIKDHFKDAPLKEVQLELGRILNVKPSTAYNKVMGRNEFSISEFLLLVKEFKVSVDALISKSSKDTIKPLYFYADGLEDNIQSYFEYFRKVMNNVVKARPGDSQTKATFVCLQPHVFHLMPYPNLLYLKLYTYNLINWRIKGLEKYDPVSFVKDDETQKLIKKLYFAYQSIHVSEMVGHNFIHPLCSQLEYLVKTKIIRDPDHLRQIKHEIYTLLRELEETAGKGMRVNAEGKETTVDMYINKFIHVSNIILIESEQGGLLTIQCDVPDVVKTYDPVFIKHFKQWLDSNQEYAINISRSGGLERKEFFERNIKHVDMVMEYLEKSFTSI